MNFFKKLFGDGNKSSQFPEADALIVKITAGFLVWHYEKVSETNINRGSAASKYSKLYFEAIEALPEIRVSQRHLLKVASMKPDGTSSEKALQLFLEKCNHTVSVFGDVLNVYENSFTVVDIDKTNQSPIWTTINILFDSGYRKVASGLKKDQTVSYKVKISNKIELMDMTQNYNVSRHIDNLLTINNPDWLIMIIGNGKMRYDLTATIINEG